MALELDKALPKAEILTRYLNLVSFGIGSFGVQDAAKTYFGVNAADLNWQQAALLAGLVQSTSTLNPYANPEAALARRNLVLDTLIRESPGQGRQNSRSRQGGSHWASCRSPRALPQGCIGAGDRAFFCDYALSYLAAAGITKERSRAQRLPDPHHARPEGAGLRQTGDRQDRQPHPRRRRERDERDQARQGRPPRARDGRQPHIRARPRAPGRPFSRSRSPRSATAAGRPSRSSPQPRHSKWGWASTLNSTCPRSSREPGSATATPPAARRGRGV